MKLSLFSLLSTLGIAYSQGTLDFVNIGPTGSGLNAPVYQSDGLTPLSGAQFMAELLAGPTANSLASIATTGFLEGAGAGYFNGGPVFVNSVVPGSPAWVQINVWSGASGHSFAQAKASGSDNSWWQSSVFSVITGNPNVNPTPPALLTGLGNSPVYLNCRSRAVHVRLAALGAVVMLSRLRRRDRSAVSNR